MHMTSICRQGSKLVSIKTTAWFSLLDRHSNIFCTSTTLLFNGEISISKRTYNQAVSIVTVKYSWQIYIGTWWRHTTIVLAE